MYGSFFDALFQNQPLIQIICDENGDDDNDVDGVGGNWDEFDAVELSFCLYHSPVSGGMSLILSFSLIS